MSSAGSRRPDGAAGDWVVVGAVVGVHGVRGEVRVAPTAERPGRLGELRSVRLALPDGRTIEARIIDYRPYEGKGVGLLRFEGYEDRTKAGALRGAQLLVPPEASPPLPPGEYYEWQLVGLMAVTVDGRELGPVEEILQTGANDVFVTRTCLIPVIPDVIRSVDLPGGRIVVEPLEGMIDGSGQ
jgi:16S rRNA processing protein RimM